MNIRTAIRSLAAAALVASTLGAGVALADQPAPDGKPTVVTEGQTRITTDKDTYVVGEPITIRYSLPGRGYIRVAMVQDQETTAQALHRLVAVLG